MLRLPRKLVHLNYLTRFREVSNILVKHGFGFVFDRIDLRKLVGLSKVPPVDEEEQMQSAPVRLRHAIEELGATYIKLGQLLSTRPDVLGPKYIFELEKLQDNVPPFAYKLVREACAKEGIDIEKDFDNFNPEPLAAGSIAQVHQASMKNGARVVVKVQRPGIDKLVETDLEILYELSKLIEKRTAWGRLYKVSEIMDELSLAITKELDFNQEGRNADIFRRNFEKDGNVLIPRVYWDYSSKKVLTLEYMEGVKISDFSGLKKAQYKSAKICENLVDALFKQVYEHGFFHADPHPGNIAVTSEERIIFYDFGQVGVIDDLVRNKCMDLLVGMMRYDVDSVTRALLSLGIGTQYINREELHRDIARLQQKYYGMPLAEIKIGEALGEIVQLSIKFQVRMPPELSLMAKMFMTVENIVSQLDPQLSIIDIAEPYGRQVIMKRYSLSHIKDSLLKLALEYARVVEYAPREIDNILNMIKEGEFKVKMEHTNLDKLGSRIDIISNRLSLAIIVASIIIGTSLLVNKTATGIITRIPLVEVGFVSAMILGLFLAYSILKSGRY